MTAEPGWRVGSIGGSDVAGILNIPYLHPNGDRATWSPTPWSVWAETVGLVNDDDRGDTERLDIGKDAERFLAAVYERHHPDRYIVDGQQRLTHPDYPWLAGHADGFITDNPAAVAGFDIAPDNHLAGWEAKTSGDLAPWKHIPAYYQCQAQTYMLLTGLTEWHFTVGFARWQVQHYTITADHDDQQLIIDRTQQFWHDHITTGVPPDPDGYPATTTAIRHAYNHPDADDIMFADEELEALCQTLQMVKAEEKGYRDHRAELENRIKARMADCSELRYGDTTMATWKPQTATRFDTTAFRADHPDIAADYLTETTHRVFRLKTPKDD